jgi:DNA repair exonuclease SbcCD ATPase subunit
LKENKKSKSEGEYWKGKYRELLSENKRLKRDLARLQHADHEFEEFKMAFEDYSIVKEEKKEKAEHNRCPACTRGKLVVILIPSNRQAKFCKICNHREVDGKNDTQE